MMIETKTQQSSSTVQDPVCGMTIDPAHAFATRRLAEETFYFCSQRCVQQFDREHTGSATTGVSETGLLGWIELSIADLDGRHSAHHLEEHLRDVPGVRQATANPKAKLVCIAYDPSQTRV